MDMHSRIEFNRSGQIIENSVSNVELRLGDLLTPALFANRAFGPFPLNSGNMGALVYYFGIDRFGDTYTQGKTLELHNKHMLVSITKFARMTYHTNA